MAAIPVTIIGVLTDKDGSQNVTLQGMASITGLEVGGGPAEKPPGTWGGSGEGFPTHPIAPGGPPPGIWPSPGHPAHPIAPGGPPPTAEHPIVLPPVEPGGPPVEIWPSPGRPTHPIVLPPPPTDGLEPGGGKPPPPDGGWGYHPSYGWGYFPGSGEAGPKT